MNFVLWMAKTLMPPERADKSRRRIVCIGDSITFGAGVAATRKTDAWTYIWQRSLGASFQVLNYGVFCSEDNNFRHKICKAPNARY